MKKIFALLLALCMLLSCAAFAEEADPAKTLTEGRWIYSFPVEGMGDFTYFFHFYEDVPGYGGVYYAGFALNQLTFAGPWTVEKADIEYDCYAQWGDQETVKGTAPYTVTFYDWDGNVVDQCGFDGAILYNDMTAINGAYSGPSYYTHDTDPENSKFKDSYEAEKGMALVDFIADDPTCTLTLYHNGRYMDLVNMMVEGNWGMTQNADGTRTYALTPDDLDIDTPATLTLAADQVDGLYVNEDGTEMTLHNVKMMGPKEVAKMAGSFPLMEGVDVVCTLSLKDDATCELSADVFGNVAVLDAGTYAKAADGYNFVFTFTAAGEVTSQFNAEFTGIELNYQQLATPNLGDVIVTLALVAQ